MDAVLAEGPDADVPDRVRVVLAFLREVGVDARPIDRDRVVALRDAGLSRRDVEDALAVAWGFHVITRLADAFDFEVGPREAFEVGADHLWERGYL